MRNELDIDIYDEKWLSGDLISGARYDKFDFYNNRKLLLLK